MDYELTSILAQAATGIATLAVAVFLSFQLRLQHTEAIISAQGELTSGLANTVSDIYTDHELTDIYLRGISEYGSLNKEDKHRFNIFMWTYFLQIQQLWETGKRAEKVKIYATIMLNTGDGIVDWWDHMGRFVYPSEYVDYLDSLLERDN